MHYALSQIASLQIFLAPKQTQQVADNVITILQLPNLLTAECKLVPVFIVKVSRPYFSMSPQGAHKKIWSGDKTMSHQALQ